MALKSTHQGQLLYNLIKQSCEQQKFPQLAERSKPILQTYTVWFLHNHLHLLYLFNRHIVIFRALIDKGT